MCSFGLCILGFIVFINSVLRKPAPRWGYCRRRYSYPLRWEPRTIKSFPFLTFEEVRLYIAWHASNHLLLGIPPRFYLPGSFDFVFSKSSLRKFECVFTCDCVCSSWHDPVRLTGRKNPVTNFLGSGFMCLPRRRLLIRGNGIHF